MNKLLIALALCAALAACKKEEAAAPATDTAAAPAVEAPAADVPAATTSNVPQECADYIARYKACIGKANPQVAAQFKAALDQAEAQWANVDAAGSAAAAQACKQANDQFAQMATAMQCE